MKIIKIFLTVVFLLLIVPSLNVFFVLTDFLNISDYYSYQVLFIEIIYFYLYIHLTLKIMDLIYKFLKSNELVFLLKTSFLVAFVMSIFAWSMVGQYDSLNSSLYGISVSDWILGYFIAFLTSYLIRLCVFIYILRERFFRTKLFKLDLYIDFFKKHIKDNEGNTGLENSFVKVLNNVLRIFTPDYSYAVNFKVLLTNNEVRKYIGKEAFEKSINKYGENLRSNNERDSNVEEEKEKNFQKETRKNFIEYTNWLNIIVACVYLLLVIIFASNKGYQDLLFCFIFFRVSSRCIEIIFAFYKDVVRTKTSKHNSKINLNYKSSSLLRGNRISLAIHSYVEVIILFTIIYYLSYWNTKLGFISLFGESVKFIDFLFYSFSISAFNVSFIQEGSNLLHYFHTLQILTSLTLVVLSLASYIGSKD